MSAHMAAKAKHILLVRGFVIDPWAGRAQWDDGHACGLIPGPRGRSPS